MRSSGPLTVLGDRVLAVENRDDRGLRYLSVARLADFAFALGLNRNGLYGPPVRC
jgi:hypothetical protein